MRFKKSFALLCIFSSVNLKIKYSNSKFGFVWSLLNPLLVIFTTSIVFSSLLQIDFYEYFVMVSTAMVGWIFFNQSVFSSTIIFISYENLIRKLSFSKYLLPLSAVCSTLIDSILFIALILLLLLIRIGPNLHLVQFIVSLVLLFIFACGCSLYFSIINVYFRDFQWILTMVLQMVFFLTPILYKRTFVNESILGYIVYINPLTYLIGNISMSLSTVPPLTHDFLMALSLALGNLAIGVLVYFKYHKNISQVL